MGVPTNIKTLLSGNVVEWARIEFKKTWDAEASLKTICAFANDIDHWSGGYIVIGVEDKEGKPANLIGVSPEKIDVYLKDMLNKCKLIQPAYMPITEVVDYKDKKFIVIWAPGGDVRPYSSPKTMAKDNKERIYWIRKMASTIAPSEEEKRDLYSLANKVPFDDRINHEADITDLNITLIQRYLKEVGSSLYEDSKTMDFTDLCKSMNLTCQPHTAFLLRMPVFSGYFGSSGTRQKWCKNLNFTSVLSYHLSEKFCTYNVTLRKTITLFHS